MCQLKATFNDFITQNSLWKDFFGNQDAMLVFAILSRDASIESMISAITEGKPALAPLIMTIEGLLENIPVPGMEVDVLRTHQAVGLMAKTILAPYGYAPVQYPSGGTKTAPLPDDSRARYFEEAAVYEKV